MDVLMTGHVAPALLDSMAIEILKERVPSSTIFSAGAPFFWTDARGQVELTRVLARRAAPRRILDAADQYLAAAWAMRGAWDSALATIDRRYAASRTLPIAVERASLGTLAYWMGASGRDAAVSRREGLASLVNASPAGPATSNASVALAFFDGLVAYIDRRGEDLDSARAALEGIPGVESSGILARELGAFRMELNGQRTAAADSLVRLEWERGGARTFLYFPTPFVRLAAGRWKGESGEAATADSLLRYYEMQTLGVVPVTNSRSTAGLAALERARAWDRAGDHTRAARYYRDFLRRYDMAPPEHRQYVTEAEAALARLVGGSDEPRERAR
jgi:hypothetical protein